MLRLLSVTLALLVALVPCAQAVETGVLDEAGNLIGVVDAPAPEDESDSPDVDVVCGSDSPTCHIAKAHMGKARTSKIYRGYHFGGRVMFTAGLEVRWNRDRWRVEVVAKRGHHRVHNGFANITWNLDRWGEWMVYPYEYAGHGSGSGYVVKRTAYFKGCGAKSICLIERHINLQLNLHADGSVKRISSIR